MQLPLASLRDCLSLTITELLTWLCRHSFLYLRAPQMDNLQGCLNMITFSSPITNLLVASQTHQASL